MSSIIFESLVWLDLRLISGLLGHWRTLYPIECYIKVNRLYPRKRVANALNCSIIVSLNYHHHHHVVLVARISLTLSRHFSLSVIASGRSSGLHPVSSHSCWMYIRASRPAFARPYEVGNRSTLIMSSSLLLQQCWSSSFCSAICGGSFEQ